MTSSQAWPELQWAEWRQTAMTLHMYSQVVGKIQLALSPSMAQWQQASLRVTGLGLGSQTMNTDRGALSIAIDLRRHEVVFDLSDGRHEIRALDGCTVADFWKDALSALDRMGINVELNPMQQEVADPLRCDVDTVHGTYDPDAANTFYQVLVGVHEAFGAYRSGFWGKQTETSFWWGTFDLAVTRFSGARAEPPAGAGLIYRVAMDAEQHEVGFWPGDDSAPEPIFYAYAYPEPEGIADARVGPGAARWAPEKSEFVLPYDAVRESAEPAAAFLEFAHTTYEASASLSGWKREDLERADRAGNQASAIE